MFPVDRDYHIVHAKLRIGSDFECRPEIDL
jgi:hypothetical protein